MNEQVGWRGLLKKLRKEAPNYVTLIPQLPRLLHQHLANNGAANRSDDALRKMLEQQKRYNTWLMMVNLLLLGIVGWEIFGLNIM